MKEEYIETIKKQIEVCEDIGLLDLIYMLLKRYEKAGVVSG